MRRPHLQGDGMNENQSDRTPFAANRTATVLGAVALGLGFVGYWLGMNHRAEVQRASTKPTKVASVALAPAPRYHEMTAIKAGANREWISTFADLKQQTPKLFDPVIRTPEMKQAALVDRLRTRAFDGAPPAIPHPIEQQSAATCLVCHAQGMKLGEKIATRVSHPHYSSCTQCHVETVNGSPIQTAEVGVTEIKNEFAGVLRSGPGSRAMPGAPPMIPHSLHLRNDCLSCHGLVARPGLRTTHPWLHNCVQCHVSQGDHPLASLSGGTP
jgi:nitrate reductase (cytochrome), electron transfer subunit